MRQRTQLSTHVIASSTSSLAPLQLVAELLELLLGLVADARVGLGVGKLLPRGGLALVIGLALDFPPLLESVTKLVCIW
jgi:hypothetical protein